MQTNPTPTPLPTQIRIALPMLGQAFSMHVGEASHFRLMDAITATRFIVSQRDIVAPEHIPGAFPKWLAEQGVEAVVVGSIGQRAMKLFSENDILVFTAQEGATTEELVALLLEGLLTHPNMVECCSGHAHDHEHGSHCH